MTTNNKISACPVCGMPLLHSCFHDGDSVTAKDLDRAHVLRLLMGTIEDLEDKLQRYKDAATATFGDGWNAAYRKL